MTKEREQGRVNMANIYDIHYIIVLVQTQFFF